MIQQSKFEQRLLKEHEAARLLSVEVATLRRWRWGGRGPCFLKIGGAVRYALSDLNEFIQSSRRQSTSERAAGWANSGTPASDRENHAQMRKRSNLGCNSDLSRGCQLI